MTTAHAAEARPIEAGLSGVVIVAAGAGHRLGAQVPKAFVMLAGRTLLQHCVDRLAGHGLGSLVLVVPADWRARVAAECAGIPEVVVVAGGVERTDSVAAGLAALPPAVQIVLVHDAARCLTPMQVFDRVIDAVRGGATAAVPAIPVVDTIKTVQVRDGVELVAKTLNRSELRAVQTPQGFDRAVLVEAHQWAASEGVGATDDATLVELLGREVNVVPGDRLAFKITTVDDLANAHHQLEDL